jgi:ArsR family transcriptional regulator, arsenate/arsenite/antimonite-responsive transcriptional repressor
MAQKKIDPFSANDIQLANLAKALSHPARISILRTLAEKNMCICGEIVDVLPLAQSTVSQHLKELKNADLVSGEVEGAKSCYCINWDKINEFSTWIKNLFDELNSKKCC